ncbi:neutral amino acid permease [Colletotrichum tofieldiae]|nr:neutral amino acid permease [Colletotrichum tofieldiae]
MVKHYLKTVCPDDIYDKFGFADFFEQKLVRKKTFICQDPDNAELTLALRCLTCLVDERVRKTEVLHSYAARLFLEDYAINSLFGIGCPFDDDEGKSALAQREIPESWNTWVVGNTGLDLLARYLKDRAVLEGMKDSDLVKAFSATDENKSLSLLRPALNTAVGHLLRADATSREVENAFLFLLAAEAKLEIYERIGAKKSIPVTE